MSISRSILFATLSVTVLAPMTAAVGQSSVAVSPFVSYVPSAQQNPFAGLSLTFGGTTGLALRAGADLAIENPASTTDATGNVVSGGGYRPWGADADAILFLGGLGGGATVFTRTLSPYLFSGLGLTGGDSAGVNIVRNSWSYGAGATIPLGLDADLFAEARWRMSEYVLPTARDAPDSKSELRFGLSFHVGGGSSQPAPAPRRRGGGRRHRYEDDDEHAERSVQSAPVVQAEPTVVVVQSAPPPAVTQTVNVVNLPAVVVTPSSRSSRRMVYVNGTRVVRPIAERQRDVTYRRGAASARPSSTCSVATRDVRGASRATAASSRRRQAAAACRTRAP